MVLGVPDHDAAVARLPAMRLGHVQGSQALGTGPALRLTATWANLLELSSQGLSGYVNNV